MFVSYRNVESFMGLLIYSVKLYACFVDDIGEILVFFHHADFVILINTGTGNRYILVSGVSNPFSDGLTTVQTKVNKNYDIYCIFFRVYRKSPKV